MVSICFLLVQKWKSSKPGMSRLEGGKFLTNKLVPKTSKRLVE